jgi:hypothetical protein
MDIYFVIPPADALPYTIVLSYPELTHMNTIIKSQISPEVIMLAHIVNDLNSLQSQGFSPKEIAHFIAAMLPVHRNIVLSAYACNNTSAMGDSVLIALSLIVS